MKDLIARIHAVGLSQTAFGKIARISAPTIKKLDENGPESVRPYIATKAMKTLAKLEADFSGNHKQASGVE